MKPKSAKHSKAVPTRPVPSLDIQIFERAVEFHRTGEEVKADPLYRAALVLNPLHPEANYNLGLILHGQGRYADAVPFYRDAIFARTDYADAYGNLGSVMKELGKIQEAMIFYRQGLAYAPTSAQGHSNMAVALNENGLSEDALISFRKALVADPGYVWSYLNMAPCLLDLGMTEASVEACRRGMAIDPSLAIVRYNLAASLKTLNRLDESIEAFRQAVALNPNFGEAHFALGQTLLMRGDYAEGWPEYDWRWTLPDYAWLRNIHGEFTQPRWRGEDARGKTLLVYAEQGLGDAIQYARYLPQLLERGIKVVVAVHPPLKPLFSAIPNVTVAVLDQTLPPFDLHCPLLGLPQIFGTTIDNVPAQVPYLSIDPEKARLWQSRIPATGRLRVGIVWAGNPTQKGDRWRSPRLSSVAPLFDVPGVDFVALQKGPGREDLKSHPLPANVLDLGEEIADFSDTAAIMAGLDLVISSCTAPLHLAGALGVPVWAVIPYSPHFLWGLERLDSPWYPSLRLYRQDEHGKDWSGAVGRMAADLARMAEAKKAS